MTEEIKKAYVARVSQANPSELIVLLYELMENCIEDAKKQALRKNMTIFRGCLNELMGSLNYEYPLSYDLRKMYVWMDKIAVEALITQSTEKLEHLQRILTKLKTGFDQVASEDKRPPVMQHAETIYAGLTYGKGSLNETVDSDHMNRGFRA